MGKIYRVTEVQLETILSKKKINKMGYQANREHKGIEANPFEKDTVDYKQWLDGWMSAESESQADHDSIQLDKEIGESATETSINEVAEDEYRIKCKADIDYYGVKYPGGYEIDYVSMYDDTISLTYNINLRYAEYGIYRAYIDNLRGEESITLQFEYYEKGEETTKNELTIPINWEMVKIEESDDINYIGLDNVINLTLANDSDGNVIISEMIVFAKQIV